MTNDLINLKELEHLTEAKKKYAVEILKRLSLKGNSEKFNEILYGDYEEILLQ